MGRVDDGVPSIWAVTGNIVALQIPRTPSHCDGRLLDSSHIKPPEGVEELGLYGQDIGEGGSGPHNVRLFLPVSGPRSTVICRRYVVGDPENWMPHGEKYDRDSTAETDGHDMVIPPTRKVSA